jgi:large repetitive protein
VAALPEGALDRTTSYRWCANSRASPSHTERPHLSPSAATQNGTPDGLALLEGTTLLDALAYEGAITAATIGGQAYNLVEGTVLPTSVEDSNTLAGSLIRNPDGEDTNDAAADWAFTTTVTRGAANVLTP